MFEDRFGNLKREFTVDLEGDWDGTTLTLIEDFLYSDGETEQRIWRITRTGDGTYEGRADDVVGVANGIARGKALNWSYDLMLKVGDSRIKVSFNDWMFLQPDGVLINKADVSKFGITIGTVTLFFQKGARPESASSGRRKTAAGERHLAHTNDFNLSPASRLHPPGKPPFEITGLFADSLI